jgi:hypothetical protein
MQILSSGINWVGPPPRWPGQNYTNNNVNNNNNRVGNEALNPDATGTSGPTTSSDDNPAGSGG